MKLAAAVFAVLALASFANASELPQGACGTEEKTVMGGVMIDESCPSSHAFQSHDFGPACLIYKGPMGTGAYKLSGYVCGDNSFEVLSATPILVH